MTDTTMTEFTPELREKVAEDVDRHGDLVRRRDNIRAKIDSPKEDARTREYHDQPRASIEDVKAGRVELVSTERKREIANSPTESILGKAHRLVQGRRGAEYGHPLDNHGATADMFAAYLQRKYDLLVPLDADDVCWFNILQKASRDANEPGEDNIVDTAGYAFNLELIRAERARRSTP